MTPARIPMVGYANAMVTATVFQGATPAQIRQIAADLAEHADRIEKGEKK